jgi:hypothetical protein
VDVPSGFNGRREVKWDFAVHRLEGPASLDFDSAGS